MPQQLSRRHFLTSSAAAAAPIVLGRNARAVSASDPDVLRVGLVGCGGRGTGAANQALRAEDGTVVLTAVADMFPDRMERSLEALRGALGENADRIQVPDDRKFLGFDAIDKLLATDVDVVLLATPPHFRPAHLAAAINAGKHVFAEKPFAVDAPGVRSVLETAALAKSKGLSLVSGFCWRYHERHRELFERLHNGAIGDIRAIYTTYNTTPNGEHARQEGWTDMEWQIRNWYHLIWLSGDHITEQACHSLDKMAWAMKDIAPLSVTATGGRQTRQGPASGNIFDHFSATFEYPDGVKGFHMSRQMNGCSYDNSDYMLGSKGTATIQGWVPLHRIEGENAWEYEGEGNHNALMYQREHDELFASIRARKPMNDGVWAAHSTMLAIMTRMSAYTGQTIEWQQAMESQEKLGPEHYSMGWVGMSKVPTPGQRRFS